MHNLFNQSFEDYFKNEIFCNLLIFSNFAQRNSVWFVVSFLLQSISMSVDNALLMCIIFLVVVVDLKTEVSLIA